MKQSRPRLAWPFTVLTGPDTVRLVAGEDFRYTLSGPGIEQWLPQLLEGCDGRRSFEQLSQGLPREQLETARQLLERLHGERVVVDGPASAAHEGNRYTIRAEGTGELLAGLQAEADAGDPILVLCQDRLDYDAALRFNRRALAGSAPWLWATYGPMSRGYVSPPFLPRAGPCLACLLRHFQRLSPAAEIYDDLIAHALKAQSIEPVGFPAHGIEILRRLVRWKVALLAEAEPPAALYRLHVLDAQALEVSSHRVLADPECPDCGGRA